jgi:2-dehydro-3-deoxygluconokinase
MNRIVCFGEIMLRLNPEENNRFLQADNFEVSYAGSEASVSVSLSNFGLGAAFVSKIPNNEIGQSAINSLRKFGVDTSDIVRGGDRLGIYFVEKGASQRPSKVIYDRKYSAISMAEKGDFDWGRIFENADWFHFSGITPALSDNMARICFEACNAAKARNIRISCDLNYRNKLWTSEKACKVMAPLMEFVDVCIANEEDAEKVFGIKAENVDDDFQSISYEGYEYVAKKLADRFGFQMVALTLRESLSASRNLWSGLLYHGEKCYISKKYDINIVDRLGAGDSFCAGLIYSAIKGFNNQRTIEFAVAASCLKHTIECDFNLSDVSEIETLMNGGTSGRVQR